MPSRKVSPTRSEPRLVKTPAGIHGLDEILGGGLPQGRPTLVCGGPGCGKSLFAMEFLVRGALDHGEPGVFVSFEETTSDLEQNFASLGFQLGQLQRRGKIALEHIFVDRSQIEESGEYDLEGLFIRLEMAVEAVGARRVVLDTIECLFAGLSNHAVLRTELRRLFHWLKRKGLTAVITGERGEGALTRQGLEEYVSDCVILLDNRVAGQISTRRLRVVKYRGSPHGNNEYPFLIDNDGISVYPLTSVGLQHTVSRERLSTGIPDLDAMLGGKGYYRGSSILISGTAGTGKSTLAASAAAAACARGERCLYFAFEESPDQIVRNMAAVGIELGKWLHRGRLRIMSQRPSYYGLEMHLVAMYNEIRNWQPALVIIDPISNLLAAGTREDARDMLLRLVDHLKGQRISGVFTNLSHTEAGLSEDTEIGISSLMDMWLLVRDVELAGERNRGIYVLKARGMAHSNQVREFRITARGIELRPAYQGPSGMLTGSARDAEEARTAQAEAAAHLNAAQHNRTAAQRRNERRQEIEARMAALRAELDRLPVTPLKPNQPRRRASASWRRRP